ncbi:DNA cytosine methyltransferase [Vibrio parahaemolyticus]|uniref:DNA cytosine methyltransferase n=1 Tax=Vibrio parahaemolyticus TaxID=670 RepID=UPI0038921F6D
MNTIDFFSGCGGLSLGFEKAGYNILAAFDFWDSAIKCYTENFSHPIFKRDLTNHHELTSELPQLVDINSIDVIMGGPPCQDFSQAGQRQEGTRANLTAEFAHTIKKIKPRYFVMENVDRALKSNAYKEARDIFKSAGYGLTEIILDSSKCSVPQKRKRLFVIGSLYDDDNFLHDSLISNLAEKSMTVRDYLGTSLNLEYYYRHPRNYNRRGIFSIDEPAPTVRGVNRPVPKGYPGHPGDPAPITDSLRPLTTKERSLLQTFPSDFILLGTKTDQEQMVGNAVPVNMAKYVASILLEHDSKMKENCLSNQGYKEERYG